MTFSTVVVARSRNDPRPVVYGVAHTVEPDDLAAPGVVGAGNKSHQFMDVRSQVLQ